MLEARTEDGWRLGVRRFTPSKTASGAVLCGHAMMVSGRTLDPLAQHLSGRGLDVFVLDFRGHGQSAPPTARERDWSFDEYVRFDLPAAAEAVARAAGCRPAELGYVGHSLGGLVVLAARAPFARVVLVTTGLWRNVRSLRRRWMMRAYASSAILLGYAPVRAVRFGTDDEPRSYVLQQARWALGNQWCSRDGRIDYEAGLAGVTAPTLSLVGAGDPLCRPRDAHQIVDRLGASEKALRVYGRATGLPFDPDHFGLVRDRRASPAWDQAARFLLGQRA